MTVVDLLQDQRKREEVLTKEYFRHYMKSPFTNNGQLKFVHFDFHRHCKGGNFENLRLLTDQMSKTMDEYGALCIDKETGQVVTRQTGALRINCLDSIDRTNVAMGALGLKYFGSLLQRNGVNLELEFGESVAKGGLAHST